MEETLLFSVKHLEKVLDKLNPNNGEIYDFAEKCKEYLIKYYLIKDALSKVSDSDAHALFKDVWGNTNE